MFTESTTTQPVPLLSHFRTTVRNELHTWIAHTVIYVAYFSIVYFLLDPLIPKNLTTFRVLLGFVTTIPVLLQLATWNYWTMGFKSRTEHFFVSILIIFAYYLINSEVTLQIFLVVTISHLTIFVTRRLIVRKRHAPDALAIIITLILVTLG